jgi:adenylate cyclase
MGREIERKFLVTNDGWCAAADAGVLLRQAYLARTGRAVVRVRLAGEAGAFFTIKSAEPGLSRAEFEYSLPRADGEALMALREGAILEKTRFHVPHDGDVWEVDVYAGENEGLVIAEIELASESDDVAIPPWLGPEVTGERRYYAAELSRRPFRAWTAEERAGAAS